MRAHGKLEQLAVSEQPQPAQLFHFIRACVGSARLANNRTLRVLAQLILARLYKPCPHCKLLVHVHKLRHVQEHRWQAHLAVVHHHANVLGHVLLCQYHISKRLVQPAALVTAALVVIQTPS